MQIVLARAKKQMKITFFVSCLSDISGFSYAPCRCGISPQKKMNMRNIKKKLYSIKK